ncbi:MAG: cytochrome c [Mucilaginibacter sp.]|uniref:c-type cytochrome n=1 Tax=Mucilaginibacter sp. TaxID=1882438 RepID=UPI0032638D21
MKLKVILVIFCFVIAATVITSCQDEGQLTFKRYYSTGQSVYQNHCQNCHGAQGEGLGALIPPLTDSSYLKTNLHQLPCFIKNGVMGNIIVNGKPYSQAMPPAQLTSIEIAEVITFVGNSFGNKIGLVDADMISEDLGKCN